MLEHTKKHHTDDALVSLQFRVHPQNVNTIKAYVQTIEQGDSVSWREVAGRRGNIPAAVLRGARSKAELSQIKLAELTGIPQRHISEMENSKRTIGKENARKLAAVLETDYRVFL